MEFVWVCTLLDMLEQTCGEQKIPPGSKSGFISVISVSMALVIHGLL